jgi:hypothetical protein
MALQIDRKPLDEFCQRLFGVLDSLGLLPLQLSAKPTEFEKYPRLLFGCIQRYNDVEAGFREWESRVLRETEFRKERQYPDLEVLRQWMAKHASLFTENKTNMQHLKSSLYARMFQYIYPRRVLVNAYCNRHQGHLEALMPEFLSRELPRSVADVVQKVQAAYQTEWETIVADANQSLLENTAYYRKVLSGKKMEETPPELNEEPNINKEED